jgi:hypothetical protein
VVALADEEVVLLDADDDVQVASDALALGLASRGGGSPSPCTRTAWPCWIPAGILTVSFRFLGWRPLPEQSGHLSLTIEPVPRHAGRR